MLWSSKHLDPKKLESDLLSSETSLLTRSGIYRRSLGQLLGQARGTATLGRRGGGREPYTSNSSKFSWGVLRTGLLRLIHFVLPSSTGSGHYYRRFTGGDTELGDLSNLPTVTAFGRVESRSSSSKKQPFKPSDLSFLCCEMDGLHGQRSLQRPLQGVLSS